MACLVPSGAQAWCRASTEISTSGQCVENPTAPLLFWRRPCVAYHFNESFFDRLVTMNEREVRAAFQASFDAWAAVDCDGRAPFLVEQLAGTTTATQSEYKRQGPNESVVLAIEAERWTTLPDHSPRAVAMTLVWHNLRTGEILDTDLELNLGAGTFADCVAGSCNPGMVDLQNTITHEAGHVLGLGHSTDRTATMTAQTVGVIDIQKRSLAPDDLEGYCALGLPEGACSTALCSCEQMLAASQSTTPPSTGCAATAPRQRNAAWAWVLACVAWTLRKRRTRAR